MATMCRQVKGCCRVKTNKFFLSVAAVMRNEWFNLPKKGLSFVNQQEWELLGKGRPSKTTGQIWWKEFGRADGGQHLMGTTTWLSVALCHWHYKNHCILLFSAFSLSHGTLPDFAFPAKLHPFNPWHG